MASYDPAFASYATRVAFDIRLTRQQIFWLSMFVAYIDSNQNRPTLTRDERSAHGIASDNFAGFGNLLIRHGLLAHDGDKTWTVTEAGRHVFALLEIAGLAVSFGNAANDPLSAKREQSA